MKTDLIIRNIKTRIYRARVEVWQRRLYGALLVLPPKGAK